jgi:hypothetical protein
MKSVLALAMALLGRIQELDNPQFKYWSGCKPGSWVKLKMDFEAGGGQKVESEMTYKLLELKDDVAVVEITGKSKLGAQEFPVPVQMQEIKAKQPADKFKIEKEGDEEIEVAGKKLNCHWYEFSMKSGDKDTKNKAWMSKDIPGGMAKVEIMPPGAGKPMIMTALEWEKK